MLEARHLAFAYSGVDKRRSGEDVFNDLSLVLEPGQFVALLGSNGSGKSTLSKLLNGLLTPKSGEVIVDGLSSVIPENAWEIKRLVGLVFQDPGRQLVAAVVESDIAFGLENLGLPSEEIYARIDEVMHDLQIEDLRLSEPHYLSGGQKQRVALASVVAMHPHYLILDEPTSMLDPRSRKSALALVHRLQHEQGLGILYITHHVDEVVDADRVLVLEKGKIVVDTHEPNRLFADGQQLCDLGLEISEINSLGAWLNSELSDCKWNCCGDGADLAVRFIECLLARGYVRSCPSKEIVSRGLHPPASEMDIQERQTIIEVQQASYAYMMGTPFETIGCCEVTLQVYEGECLGVIGSTGSGKSTLLQLLNGLLLCQQGVVKSFGEVLNGKVKPERLAYVRQNIGFLFQSSEQQLFEATVYDDVAFGPRNYGLSEEVVRARVESAVKAVGLEAKLLERSPFSLSGGEKRRVALAGVLACEPKCLVLDEPTAGLDPVGVQALLQLLKRLNKESGLTLVVISHRYDEVVKLADRLAVMAKGKLLQVASVPEVLYDEELLTQAQLDSPEICRMFGRLHREGVALDMWPVEFTDARSCCCALLG